MTHQKDYTFSPTLLDKLMKQGLDGASELFWIVLNEAMWAKREKYLRVNDYKRSEERSGYANGNRQKTVKTRMAEITFDIPRVQECGSYPSALEKGMRSERA